MILYVKPTQPFGGHPKSKFGTSAVGAPLWQNLAALIYAKLFQMYDNSRACGLIVFPDYKF